ncbi:MAG: DUF6067 family protein [Kiritimatiellia bacterium]|nr:DUF6067 family protein [Kiritimatiellia bacterium]
MKSETLRSCTILLSICMLQATGLAALLDEPSESAGEIPRGSKNLFLGAESSADKVWSRQKPELAVNGKRNSGDHWAGPPIPATHTIDLKKSTKLNALRVVTWWNGKRYYQYHVEVSEDGKEWKRIVDESANTTPATKDGREYLFDPVNARYVRTKFTKNSEKDEAGGHIVEIEGYMLGEKGAGEPSTAFPKPLAGGVGSVDVRYARSAPPGIKEDKDWSAVAWRGERVHGQFAIWTGTGLKDLTLSTTDLKGPSGATIPAANVVPFFVRYTMGEGQLIGDILEPAKPIDIETCSTRPIWLSVNVPAAAKSGKYRGTLKVAEGSGKSVVFNVGIEVMDNVLPSPDKWSFHLDLWQHPWAVARVHKLEPFSEAHWNKLREVLELAANAGQKCLTTTIVDRPWGHQTHDPFGSMIKPTRKADGTWTYDYSLFDKYVEFGLKCGINRQINCYSMVPWGNNLYYQDEASGEYKKITAKPGSKDYDDYWAPLLKDFSAHLKKKGWFEKTTIAMDERHLDDMKNMIALVDRVSPGFKITLAANKNLEEISDRIHDYCFAFKYRPKPELSLERAASGRPTTYYVCCAPRRPNTFPFSPPAESTWLGWRAAAYRYTGFLRWAFCSYTLDPFKTTDYPRRSWPTGDCYVIYPGPRTSIRFERLREGIQDYEKIRLVREALEKKGAAGKADLEKLEAILGTIQNRDHTGVVKAAKKDFEELSRRVKVGG